MRVLHVSNHSTPRCGVAEFGRQFSAAVRQAGVDCTDWDGSYPAIYEKPYLPADVASYDVVHFNWQPATLNHYRPQHLPYGPKISVCLHDLEPWSSCAIGEQAQVLVTLEPDPQYPKAVVLPPPCLPPRPPQPLPERVRIGRTGIGSDGAAALASICEARGWELSDSATSWVSNEEELDRLGSCWANVVWYTYHRSRSSAASVAASARRPLVLSPSTRFLHLTEKYSEECYVTPMHGLEAQLDAIVGDLDHARVPDRMVRDLQWDRVIPPVIQAWETARCR